MNISSDDLKNENWAEFDVMDKEDPQPNEVPTTKTQQENIRLRAERGSSRSNSRSGRKKNSNLLDF